MARTGGILGAIPLVVGVVPLVGRRHGCEGERGAVRGLRKSLCAHEARNRAFEMHRITGKPCSDVIDVVSGVGSRWGETGDER
jgi:hypothetical protein